MVRLEDQRPLLTASTLVTVHPSPLNEIDIHRQETSPQIGHYKHVRTNLNNTPTPFPYNKRRHK